MDIYHTGKEEANDDHKFVNERLLEVAIPPQPEDGTMITLEDCLEAYFNNKIEVKRHLQRRNTLQSVRSIDATKGGQVLHIESIEVPPTPTLEEPAPQTPGQLSPFNLPSTSPLRPNFGRGRTDSIFSERRVLRGSPSDNKSLDDSDLGRTRKRAGTLKREVLMPAWQFFSLIRKLQKRTLWTLLTLL